MKELLSDLLNASENPSPDVSDRIILWHVSDDDTTLRSFMNDGAQAIGKGYGGQKKGFYAWNNKGSAVCHFCDFLYEHEAGEGLLIGVEVDKKKMTYPDWQFDVELASGLSPLLFKYKDEITKIKDLKYKNEDEEERTIESISLGKLATEKKCSFCFKTNGCYCCYAIANGYLGGVDLFQAVIDKMCENPDFRKEYDELLQKSVSDRKRLAVKYCGDKPLPIDRVSYIRKQKEGDPVETELHTSAVSKEKQVCPFLKMGMAKKKKSLGG